MRSARCRIGRSATAPTTPAAAWRSPCGPTTRPPRSSRNDGSRSSSRRTTATGGSGSAWGSTGDGRTTRRPTMPAAERSSASASSRPARPGRTSAARPAGCSSSCRRSARCIRARPRTRWSARPSSPPPTRGAHPRGRSCTTGSPRCRAARTTRRWPWPEPRLAYGNALLPEALIAGGNAIGDDAAVDEGLRLLRWLVAAETLGDHFSFTPAAGRGPGDARPAFDQQPIEAGALADACARAFAVTHDDGWLEPLRCAPDGSTG